MYSKLTGRTFHDQASFTNGEIRKSIGYGYYLVYNHEFRKEFIIHLDDMKRWEFEEEG